MADLHVFLTEGFRDDRVIVSVDGSKVFDKLNVTTKKIYGLAEELGPLLVDGESASITVDLPDRGLSSTFTVDLKLGAKVPIAVENGAVNHSVEKEVGFM